MNYPISFPVIEVSQPIGNFYITSIPARVLLDTCYSDRLRAKKNADGSYDLVGNQRAQNPIRLKQIADYINSTEMAFPNSIILSANFRPETEELERDESVRWKVEFEDSNNLENRVGRIIIPSEAKLVSIIDGQHRLFAFNKAQPEKLDTSLICSIFLDLPKPFQAYLFATINSTQRPVNRSQTYELFGYNIEDEPADSWGPEKLAVFIARKLNADPDSKLIKRIIIAAENDIVLSRTQAKSSGFWMISMATVVDGIAGLISTNTVRDATRLSNVSFFESKSRELLKNIADKSPLRMEYLNNNDKLIYEIVLSFFSAVDLKLFSKALPGSFITKTIGIQALFDILKTLAAMAVNEGDISVAFFEKCLTFACDVDFSSDLFRNASGSGRSQIRKSLEESIEKYKMQIKE